WAAVLFIVDFDPNAKTVRCIGRIDSKLRRIGRQRGIPIIYISYAADGEHYPNAAAREVVDDVRGHTDWDSLGRGGVIGQVQQLHRIDETENDQIHRRDSIATVNKPVVLAVEFRYRSNRAPCTVIVAAMPGAINRDGRPSRLWRNFRSA